MIFIFEALLNPIHFLLPTFPYPRSLALFKICPSSSAPLVTTKPTSSATAVRSARRTRWDSTSLVMCRYTPTYANCPTAGSLLSSRGPRVRIQSATNRSRRRSWLNSSKVSGFSGRKTLSVALNKKKILHVVVLYFGQKKKKRVVYYHSYNTDCTTYPNTRKKIFSVLRDLHPHLRTFAPSVTRL